MATHPICHIVSPVGMLGYGFEEALTAHELAKLVSTGVPTAIILDSGSTDSGPEKLAIGTSTCPRSAYVKDLTKLLRIIHTFRVPLIFSSAGGDGSDEHVRMMEGIIDEIVAEEQNKDYGFKTISIYSGIDKTTILERLKAGRISGCGSCVPTLTEEDIKASPRVVAQVGPEPFIAAMEEHPDFNIVIGGRAYDPAPYVAYSIFQLKRQLPELSAVDIESRYGGFTHMGKIMECGGLCSTPKSHGAVSTVYASGLFDVRPMAPESRCTPGSVAAHTLYENARPDILRGPGGELHLLGVKYEQRKDGRTVRVSGSKYVFSRDVGQPHCLKLEAARVIGYRSMFFGSVADPILISQLEKVFKLIKVYVAQQHPNISGEWDLDFHVYGKGQRTASGPGPLFVIAEAIAPTQQLANSLASKARVGMIHAPYPGQKATSGNFGFGLGGRMELEMGPCAKFSLYHLMELEPGEETLAPGNKSNGATKGAQLLHSSVAIRGMGRPLLPDDDFRSAIALRQDSFAQPPPDEATRVRKEDKPKAGIQPPEKLSDIAEILRSKNAGPYEITMDVVFDSEASFNFIKKSDLLSRENVARALQVSQEDIIWIGFYDPAIAFKVTIPRYRGGKKASAGSFMENDIHGSQQHLGLFKLKLPEPAFPGALISRIRSALDQPWYGYLALTTTLWAVSKSAPARRLFSRN